MPSFVQNLLNQNRKRALGSLMRHIESRVYPKLTPAEQTELRAKVIQVMEVYHDNCLDILKASVNEGVLMNDEVLVILQRMEGTLRDATREVAHG